MFQTRLTNYTGHNMGPPIWVTGNADEAKQHGFAWSEILQVWAKPADRPSDEGNWPRLLDGGVYTLPVFSGPSGEHTFVALQAFDERGFVLHTLPGYLQTIIGGNDDLIGAWHVDVTGVVYDSDMQAHTDVTALEHTGVVLYGVHSDVWTPERTEQFRKVVGRVVRDWLSEDADYQTNESALAADADEQEASMGL